MDYTAKPPLTPQYNLLMFSGDSSVARGHDGAFHQMLARFSQYWARIDILTPPAPGASERVIHGNVHVHPSPHHRLMQPWFIRQRGAALLQERRYALVLSHDYGFFLNGIGAWWLLRGRNIPFISEVHHIEGYPRAVNWRERAWRAAAMRYLPWVAQRAAAIRVVNHDEVPSLLRRLNVPEAKIRVLPSLYLDLDAFQPQPDVDKFYDVLFVGRLASNKGVDVLLRAFNAVHQTHPAARLGLRGDGPLMTQVDAFIRERGLEDVVTMVPRVPDITGLATLYNRAKMLVCASTVEGGPRVTAEAMACGVPVISTRVGIMPEIIRDGENGCLFDGDASQLAAIIRDLLDDEVLRQRLGEAGWQAVQRYDANRTIAAYAHGCYDVIANAAATPATAHPQER